MSVMPRAIRRLHRPTLLRGSGRRRFEWVVIAVSVAALVAVVLRKVAF